ncbi:MAG: hypothetical protein AAF862_10385, partial [Pseudomonadota bacterium]
SEYDSGVCFGCAMYLLPPKPRNARGHFTRTHKPYSLMGTNTKFLQTKPHTFELLQASCCAQFNLEKSEGRNSAEIRHYAARIAPEEDIVECPCWDLT